MSNPTKNQQYLDHKINFFKSDLKSDIQKKEFEPIYKKYNGNWSSIKSELIEKEEFTPEIINNLEFTHRLSEWSNDNTNLIILFQNDNQIHSIRDIAANFSKTAFIEKVKDMAPAELDEDKKDYAVNLHQQLFKIEPTALVANMIRDPQVSLLNDAIGGNVATVLEKIPDYNIRTTSVYEMINQEEVFNDIPIENQEKVISQLKTLQRITAVSPDTEALPVLYNANLHSAMSISTIPQSQFLTMMNKSGLEEVTIKKIHSNAQQVRARNEQSIIALREVNKGTGIDMIDKSLNMTSSVNNEIKTLRVDSKSNRAISNMEEQVKRHNLSWDLLFGDADFCECGECNSVYSAAAYYVELLQYLRNNNLDLDPENPMIAKKPDSKDISGTPLEKLFERRPDLGCLELTCQNTNTVLPYVDLVNEVMENYVAFKKLKPFNVGDETSSELLAEPQNTEYQAYCILKDVVYPFTLPYHQPIDAQRIYLNHLDTSRYELIKTFRKNNMSDDKELTQLKEEALDRAADAEFLGLTMEEYVILTKESFISKALMVKLKNKTFTDEEYRKLSGVKPVYQYYGYDDENKMLGDGGLTLIKKEFLRRTGIDYVNLVDLIKTSYINPNKPEGKSKIIMESLHFSYRILQSYAKVHGMNKMAEELVKGEKLAKLVPHLKDQIESLTNHKSLSCPPSKNDEIEITDKDIIHWVKCNFEKVGKIIVIESGRNCVDGDVLDSEIRIEDCIIYDDGNKIGHVDINTGRVTFDNENTPFDINAWKDFTFRSDDGEEGVFWIIDHSLYLVFLQQQDSCNLDTARLQHLDGNPLEIEEYDRIHRFIRLWRKLDWTFEEIELAIVGLNHINRQDSEIVESICDDWGGDDCDDCGGEGFADCNEFEENDSIPFYDINPTLIQQLVAVKKLQDKTGLELNKLLTFWSNISTSGEKSLYHRLFLTYNILGIDKIFKADANGNYLSGDAKLFDHVPVLMAALNLSADEIQAIIDDKKMDDKLSLSNLSILYRYRLLSKVLGLRITDFIRIRPIFGDVFYDAVRTLEFIDNWEKIQSSGFSYQQLNYILMDVDNDKKPFTPDQKTIFELSKTMYDGLMAIEEEHKDLKADSELTDSMDQKVNIEEQATSALIRSKASLLFETEMVEKIIGILEGTHVFKTNAPKDIDMVLSETSTLKNKLKYDKVSRTIQITGILTEAEVFDYKAINNSSEWISSLTRIQKQQDRLFKELLFGVIEQQIKTEEDRVFLDTNISIIKSGDIMIPLEKIPEGEEDPNSAPKKRLAFLNVFLPYLRKQLTHRFVISTLADFIQLDVKVTDILVTDILKHGSAVTPIYTIFENIKESTKPEETEWSGYLIPSANTNYTFIIKNNDSEPNVSIDGKSLVFTAQEDPTNEWWSDPIPLQSGKLYKLTTKDIELKNAFWKTPASTIAGIPSTALLPEFASEQCEPALIALIKAAMLVSTFELSADEIKFFDFHKEDFENMNFNNLTFPQWLRLEAYTRFRHSIPENKLNLLEFWKWVYEASPDDTQTDELINKIVDLTSWKYESIKKLIADKHFNIGQLGDYRNERNLLKLQKALTVADKISIDINWLFQWAVPSTHFNKSRKIAESIKHAIRAKYTQSDWDQVVKPLHDQLRNHQKEALIAYLLQQEELIALNVIDADGLFEYFLIDVQMEPCMETSRIKQAISSVQLFVQRCFLGLEGEQKQKGPKIPDRKRWEWMQRYRVWEANRKVFLYPENWIESNLRDDKSPFFKELESELLQKDINKQNVTDALKSYLYKLDEVANMEVVGFYIDRRMDLRWEQGSKLHVFARTRNTPYFYYYRYVDLFEMNWYPWEKIQVDIPSFDVEDRDSNVVTDSGCYLIPAVLNSRLFIFFPQVMRKTRPNNVIINGNIGEIGNADNEITAATAIEFFEIKMAWSEYRNGKWMQKQVSNTSIFSDSINDNHRIEYMKFVPLVLENSIKIYVDDKKDSPFDNVFKGIFEFDGSSIKTRNFDNAVVDPIPITYFNQSQEGQEDREVKENRMYSWQLDKNGNRTFTDIYFTEDVSKELVKGIGNYNNFHHPDTNKLLETINLAQLEGFFKQNLEMLEDNFGPIDHDNDNVTDIFHELKRPYSLYNWELFFHTPILLADALSKAQQFEEAMKWFHYVFNPIADGYEDNRYWQFQPFNKINSQRILDNIFNNLKPDSSDESINEWRNNPFMPHVVARSRPVAYMKWVVMKYIDNLIAWGDYLFRQDTIESINEATQLYVLAGHILGPRPMMIPKRGKIEPQTYLSLLDKWDAFSNAMVELELAAPFSNQTDLPFNEENDEIANANIFGSASSLYFCIPNNPKLMGYWDTLADRLYKIRHCQNIAGVFRKLPLFEPPIDPGLLVKAAAQGLSISSVLNDLNTPMPNYRFYYLLQKALELCNELKSLGSSMLSAIEKKDNETIALIRAKHEGVMQNLLMEVKKKQLDEAQRSIESLRQNRITVEERMKYYLKLIMGDSDEVIKLVPDETAAELAEIPDVIENPEDVSGLKLISFEKEDMEKASEAQNKQLEAALPEKIASIMHIIPNLSINIPPITSFSFGGSNLGAAAQAWAKFLQLDANELSYASTSAGKKGGFTRALQERIFQAKAAGYELLQINKQITAQQIRLDIANQEIINQQKAIDNANEVEEFIKNKYTNEELYTWMRGSLKTLYHQVYKLAYELAKKAEKTYCFERGISNANFIQPGYYDAGREGLLAGEQLYVGLKQLEAAYQNERGHDYEITKQISLYQLNPMAILQLRATGKCEFALPEELFDMDYPGHYKRRIKAVSLTIPCIAGPYTGINATFRLLENKFRNTAIGGKKYEENTEENDDRFSSYSIPINAIAASSAQNDSGMFELNFKDERYLPFEGAGVISKWRLELPTFRQFDYHSISDIIIHLRYTACEGGERLKAAANKSVSEWLKNINNELNETGLSIALNMKHDLSNEWHLLKQKGYVDLKIEKSRLPFIAQNIDAAIENVMFLAKVKDNPVTFSVKVDGNDTNLNRIDEWNLCRGNNSDIDLDKSFALSVDPTPLNNLEELMMVVKYSF